MNILSLEDNQVAYEKKDFFTSLCTIVSNWSMWYRFKFREVVDKVHKIRQNEQNKNKLEHILNNVDTVSILTVQYQANFQTWRL